VQARANYLCRHCGESLGCGVCIDDVATLVCTRCHDWGNLISEKVHGPMIKDKELKAQAMKLVAMLFAGQINGEEYLKLWSEAKDISPRI